jgi:hypothetical protein
MHLWASGDEHLRAMAAKVRYEIDPDKSLSG